MSNEKISKSRFSAGEIVSLAAGFLFFASTAYIASGGNFTLSITAKIIYGIGVVLLIVNR